MVSRSKYRSRIIIFLVNSLRHETTTKKRRVLWFMTPIAIEIVKQIKELRSRVNAIERNRFSDRKCRWTIQTILNRNLETINLVYVVAVRDWAALVPPTAAVAGIGYMSYLAFCPHARPTAPPNRVNHAVRLSEAKVADFVDIEDIAEKAAFCRCWKSKNVRTIYSIRSVWLSHWSHICMFLQWPYCDGSHGTHNKETGDNLGPIVLKRNPEKWFIFMISNNEKYCVFTGKQYIRLAFLFRTKLCTIWGKCMNKFLEKKSTGYFDMNDIL